MTIADKLIETMLQYTPGTVVRTQDILATMQERYPEVPIGSIRPADFCDNWVNKDPVSGKVHIFHRVARGRFRVLGLTARPSASGRS